MTTIVYRNAIMASDSRAYSGNKAPIGTKAKMRRLKDGSLLGVSSCEVGEPDRFAAWLEANDCKIDPSNGESFPVQALLVRPKGDVYYWNDGCFFSGPIMAEYMAIGSGDQFALGAMAMGADAVRAIEVVTELDTWSGSPVATMTLKKPSASKSGRKRAN